MLPSDDHGSYAVIDLVAHLYRGGAEDRRALAGIWNRYSEATESERKSKGFELVRMHHATLTRMFRDGACVRVGWIRSRCCLSEPNAKARTNDKAKD